jgi:hypothetical protein
VLLAIAQASDRRHVGDIREKAQAMLIFGAQLVAAAGCVGAPPDHRRGWWLPFLRGGFGSFH